MAETRAVPEWIGDTPDTTVPPRVRQRVWLRCNGKCQICTRKIMAGETWINDHIRAIINGGENRESNLQVICTWCDRKVKTPADVKEKSKVARVRAAHLGIKEKKPWSTKWKKKMDGTTVLR